MASKTGYFFITKAGLSISKHVDNNHGFDCCICENNFTSEKYLIIHYVIHHQLKYCHECLQLFTNDDHLLLHLNASHIVDKCSKCHCEFTKTTMNNKLNAHYRQVHSIGLCDLCTDLIEPIAAYKDHLTYRHNILPSIDHRFTKMFIKLKDDLFFCQLCSLRFQFQTFIDHYASKHLISTAVLLNWIQRPHSMALQSTLALPIEFERVVCPICDQKYTLDAPKLVHAIYCAGKKYCEACDQLFCDSNAFEEHDGSSCVRRQNDESLNHNVICKFCGENVKLYDRGKHKAAHQIVDEKEIEIQSTICAFCPADNDHNLLNVQSIVDHYLNYHRMNHACLLSSLSSSRHSQALNAVYTEIPPVANDGATDFDTRMVKFIYSSIEGSSSDEVTENARCTFLCQMCNHRAVSKTALINHMNKVHGFTTKPIEFRCRICNSKFSSLRILRMHRRSKHWPIGKAESCTFCDCTSESRTALRDHMKQHVEITYHPCKSRLIGHNCRYCRHTSWTEDQLNDHIMNMHAEHVRDNFTLCICCAASLSSMNALRSHMLRLHPTDDFVAGERFLFQCEICKINFPVIAAIRKHMNKVHPELQAIFCPIPNCVQMIVNNDSLLDHNRVKHRMKNKFQCSKCPQNFPTKLAAKNHHEKQHS